MIFTGAVVSAALVSGKGLKLINSAQDIVALSEAVRNGCVGAAVLCTSCAVGLGVYKFLTNCRINSMDGFGQITVKPGAVHGMVEKGAVNVRPW
jgi:hypothetical protein